MVERAEVNEIIPAIGATGRNHIGEKLSRETLINKLKIKLNDLPLRLLHSNPQPFRCGLVQSK